jgi:hypothetical protein
MAGFVAVCDALGGNAPTASVAPPPTPAPVAPVGTAPIAPIAPVAPIGSSPLAPAAPPVTVAPIAPSAPGAFGGGYTYVSGAAVVVYTNGVSAGSKTNSVYWITNSPYGNPTSGYTNKSIHVLPPAAVNTNTTSQIR